MGVHGVRIDVPSNILVQSISMEKIIPRHGVCKKVPSNILVQSIIMEEIIDIGSATVSYTHLTLPTILLV